MGQISRDLHPFQIDAVRKAIVRHVSHLGRNGKLAQGTATEKGSATNVIHRLRQAHLSQGHALAKGISSHGLDPVGE